MIYSQLSAQFVQTTGQIIGGIGLFVWQTLTRFAKTVGFLAIIGGFLFAISEFRQLQPRIDSLRYEPSALLNERLRRVQELYDRTGKAVLALNASSALPPAYAAAATELTFPAPIASEDDFQQSSDELFKAGSGKELLKSFVTERFEKNVGDIQHILRAHAASLRDPPPAQTNPAPPAARKPSPFDGLLLDGMNNVRVEERKRTLVEATEVLSTLKTAAEDPASQKKLEDAIAELKRFETLFPDAPAPLPPTAPANQSANNEPLEAERVAQRLDELRNSVRWALFTAWALDQAYEEALQTLEQERSTMKGLNAQIRDLNDHIYQIVARDIAIGLAVGLFFLLIGDWTQKASTFVHEYYPDLIPDYSASPDEVYSIIETSVRQKQVPDLECSRERWHEGGAISAKREYLKFSRERHCFEICAAPFGTGFFVSYRVTEVPLVIDPLGIVLLFFVFLFALAMLINTFGLQGGIVALVLIFCVCALVLRHAITRGLGNIDRILMKIPLLAPLYELYLRPVTYYRVDSMEMYHRAVRAAVVEALRQIFPDHPLLMRTDILQPPAHPQFPQW